jgi:hypothetical protein
MADGEAVVSLLDVVTSAFETLPASPDSTREETFQAEAAAARTVREWSEAPSS